MLEVFAADLKHAFRMFRQSPAFTAAAVAALALGIGANTAVFSVVNTVLLKPVPFPDPDRLVLFMNVSPDGSGPGASPAKFAKWRGETSVVQDVAAYRASVLNDTTGAVPEQLQGALVSADYFRLLGAPLVAGRTFTADEDQPRGPRVAVISEGLWARRFNRDTGAIGRTIDLSGEPYVVVGVIGASFDLREFGDQPQVWIPFQLDPNSTDHGNYFTVAGRLRSGVTLAQAQARLGIAGTEFRERFPAAMQPDTTFSVQPLRDAFVRNARTSLLVLVGAVSFVLLIACANVANLLLARATGRRREIAIRAAIGAGRGRIIRQLLTESVVLSLVGGLVGTVVGVIGIRALLAVNTAGLPRVGDDGTLVGVDWRVLGFTFVVSLVTGVLFGLIPALQSSRADLNTTLKESAGRSGSGFRQNKARSLLVVSEVALALILLVGSALLIRTSMALGSVEPGFNTENVLTMRTSLTGPRFVTSAAVSQIVRTGLERVRALPGVVAASATCCVPLQGGYGLPFIIVGRPLEGPFTGGGGWLTVSPGYFEVFEIPVKRGRAFTDRDDALGPPVVVINEAMARQYWPEGDPLNDRLIIGRGVMAEFASEPERQIVGIVGDVRDGGLNNDPSPRMYIPQAQVPDAANALNVRISPMAWVVRTQGPPQAMSARIQEELRQASGLPLSSIMPMTDVVSASTSRQRFNMLLMTVFGAAALLLAAIGIYGLMAYSVQQRTQEIGIRLCLGADTGQVRRLVVVNGMALAGAGIAVGLLSAFGLTRFVESLLFGVEPLDLAVFLGAPTILVVIALLAVWFPAVKASRVDPIEALRAE